MNLKKFFLPALLGSATFLAAYCYPSNRNPQDKESWIIRAVLQVLKSYHYEPQLVDDQLSKTVFKEYIEKIDNGKRFFIQPEIDQLQAYQTKLDDEATNATFQFFNLSNELIEKAVLRVNNFYPKLLEKPFDLEKDELFETNPDKLTWAKSESDLKDYWKQIFKFEIMTKVIDKQKAQDVDSTNTKKKTFVELEKEARAEVKKNYDEYFKRLSQWRRQDRFNEYINSIVVRFDPHSEYLDPKEKQDFNQSMSGVLEGIGARLQVEGELTKVAEIIPGGPAWKQKQLQANDYIIKVAQEGQEPKDIRGMRLDDAILLIKGKKGTKVILTVKKVDGSIKEIEIVRDLVILDESFAKSAILSIPNSTDNIGYIKLPKFYADFEREGGSSCAVDVAKEIEKLGKNNVKGIILDLRNNGGGSLKDVVQMSGLFIEDGPIVQVKSRDQQAYVLNDQDSRVQYNGPLVVLVNHFSASASEILAAAMQDYKRAIIVGSTSTFGKGTVQRFVDLNRTVPQNEALSGLGDIKITTQKFFRITGESTQLKGVIPDIILPDNFNYIKIGEKEFDNSLVWNKIDPVQQYDQKVYKSKDMIKIKELSKERLAKNASFQLVDENAKRIKNQRDVTSFPLSLKKYKSYVESRDANNKKFENLFKENRNIQVANMRDDVLLMANDSSKIARNEAWFESIKRDIQLEESMYIIRDMIQERVN
jgi:carboxyl-terminal processing protease